MSEKTSQWYVIQVISGTEENVKQSLFQRRESFGLENYLIDVFVPTHDVVSIRAGGTKVKKKKNILPGYILVEMVVTNEILANIMRFLMKLLPSENRSSRSLIFLIA